jgi:sensor histidine kinase YesM
MNNSTHNSPPLAQELQPNRYLLAQLIFWGSYLLLNVIFISAWASVSVFTTGIFIGLSLLLGITSHGLRALYHRYQLTCSFLQICLNLLWLLPLAALLVQLVLHAVIYAVLQLAPAQASGIQPVTAGSFIGYSLNTTIMLLLWSILYLLRSEFKKRREMEITRWRDQAKLRDIELQFLRSQINSHFLFNSLNNLRALILEDPHAARQGLSDLATLLRGLLQAEAHITVPLREELDWVRGYLALEALQFEQRLQYEFVIDDSLLDAKVPPLLVQTLVENAIKHGIAGRRSGGLVSLRAQRLNNSEWQLEVENPAAELPALHQGNGIGLANARERLAMAFGERAKLDLQLGAQVIACVRLPLAKETGAAHKLEQTA